MSLHTATIVEENGTMVIFGGDGNEGGVAYTLDLTDMRWSRMNNVQYERRGHSANLIGNSIYLFGGYFRSYRNDIFKYDIK